MSVNYSKILDYILNELSQKFAFHNSILVGCIDLGVTFFQLGSNHDVPLFGLISEVIVTITKIKLDISF